MKIVMSMNWTGITLEQYEAIRREVNWEGDNPKGGILHLAGFYEGALRVTDVWASADEFNNFVQNRLMPGVARLNIHSAPQVDVFPMHASFFPVLQV